MSRAFVKEDDEETAGFKYDSAHTQKLLEWLRIQEKKLDFLLNDPKGQAVEASKRDKWIKETESSISAAREKLGMNS
ncbi:MAG: hypothetical protein LBQ58_04580 [Synergistaceae bacterium]|nr:hypothetical protein [Synergistaceae bacterium]